MTLWHRRDRPILVIYPEASYRNVGQTGGPAWLPCLSVFLNFDKRSGRGPFRTGSTVSGMV